MSNDYKSISDNETFVRLIQVAECDPAVKQRLVSILELPSLDRKSALMTLVENMKSKGVDTDFTLAIAAFTNDEVTNKALKLLNQVEIRKSPLEIYTTFVCYVAIIFSAISIGIAIYGIVEITYPEFTINAHIYKSLQSNDAYWSSRFEYVENRGRDLIRPSESELTKQRQERLNQEMESEKINGLQRLETSAFVLFTSLLFYISHRALARRVRARNQLTQERMT